MGLNETPSANRLHIGFFGNRNTGKSSLLNAITGQELAVVSDVKGTTTDPVTKAMELLPIGPVVFIDTPGLDDEGELGQKRIEKSFEVLRKIDFAIVVLDGQEAQLSEAQERLLKQLKDKKLPFVVAINKMDAMAESQEKKILQASWAKDYPYLFVSALTKSGVEELKNYIANAMKENVERDLIKDLLKPEDVVVLVTPIDAAAPKGRMILPQQQTIRDILDGNAICMVTKETTLPQTLASLKEPPKMVVTDSQAFKIVDEMTPHAVPLTSFSILFARLKGNLEQQVQGAYAIGGLQDGAKVLISEGCTHHRQCGDIGTEKLPKLLKKFTGKQLELTFTSGTGFERNLTQFDLIIHCGGCMLNEKEMKYRLAEAKRQSVPMTNYGVAIAYMNGILERSLEPLNLL
ncbi:MAG: [FeFe] hydrogenase H-cluster maturation GTPase HydF [Lachnospiraceae bacterium]|jgi:[FeFe] hydrogenase H-cluster maturation GTPase HydF|nr:[FeFe] hydrogenase H-cluster maturation GTPase HydF [Lachnospiraceae bacterium]